MILNARLKRELAATLAIGAVAGFALRRGKRPAWAKGLLAAAGLTLLWPTKQISFKDKAVVITGGSRGLGYALAEQLLREGAKVTILARDGEELEHARHELRKISTDIFCVSCDVTHCEALDNAFAEARARFGTIDVLINNAGVVSVGPFESMDRDDFRAQIDLHLGAVVTSTRLVRTYFRQNGGGQIINISSLGGKLPIPHMAAYCASKFALGGFSESVAAELRRENIFVTTAYPGLMRTGSPIQAVFKGDHEAEYAWFQLADVAPGVSMDAHRAAGKILNAARDRRTEVVVSCSAKLGALTHALFPELLANANVLVNEVLPKGQSRVRKTGADSQGRVLDASIAENPIGASLLAREDLAEQTLNQHAKQDADYNLGLRT